MLIATTVFLALPNCFGGFVLTGKWHGFIKGINNKWLRWIVFLITCIVYGITIWVDAILFNSIEFWSGSNPMAMSDFDERGQLTKTLERDGEKVTFTYRNLGADLRIDMWKDGDYKGNMVLLKNDPGQFYNEQNGELLPIQVTEQELSTGRLVTIRAGEVVTRRELGVMEYYALRDASERALRGQLKSGSTLIAGETEATPAPAF